MYNLVEPWNTQIKDNPSKCQTFCATYPTCCNNFIRTVTAGCGNTFSENCTYFDSATVSAGSCVASICKCQTNICQMRLDFNAFTISGPSTLSTSVGIATFGNLQGTGAPVSSATQCLTGRLDVCICCNDPPLSPYLCSNLFSTFLDCRHVFGDESWNHLSPCHLWN